MSTRLATDDWRPTTALIPRIIAVAGGLLILYQWAMARPLWLDEEMIALNLRERGLVALGGRLSLGQSAPYGWLVIERFVLDLFGGGERALRLVPMLLGLGAIATAWWIGRRWLWPIAASMLILMIAVGQWVSYSYVELKHYSADVCFSLLLPALAVWAVEVDRVVLWWIVAALAQFVGNGAPFVAPACAVVIVVATWSRRGARAAVMAAAPGLLWLTLFATNYLVVLRPTQTSEFLQTYWQLQFPPRSGVYAIARWFGDRLVPFAIKPGGTRVGIWFWIVAAIGFAASTAAARRRWLAAAFALVPLSAFALSAAHVVPFFERLVLWAVPAMFVGIALFADIHPVAAALAAIIVANIAWIGLDDLRARPRGSHHRLDDRSAVRWLVAREQPGDVWVTTQLALPAIWWYGPGAREILRVRYIDPGRECQPDALAQALEGKKRALVFLAFRFDDVPRQFDDLLMNALTERGQITAYRGLGDASRVAIVDLRLTSRRDRVPPALGCIGVQPAQRW